MNLLANRLVFCATVTFLLSAHRPASAAPPYPLFPQPTTSSPPTTTSPPEQNTSPTTNTSSSLQNFLNIHGREQEPEVQVQPLPVGFHLQLGSNLTLRRYSEIQLHSFFGIQPGHFTRGTPSFEAYSGAFTVPRRGIYHFTAQVHLTKPNLKHPKLESFVTVSICINRDCNNYASLEASAGVNSERFSVIATGALDLEVGHQVSVIVTSGCDRRLVIEGSSSFLGYFLGE